MIHSGSNLRIFQCSLYDSSKKQLELPPQPCMDTHLTSLVKQTKLVHGWWNCHFTQLLFFLLILGNISRTLCARTSKVKSLKSPQVACPDAEGERGLNYGLPYIYRDAFVRELITPFSTSLSEEAKPKRRVCGCLRGKRKLMAPLYCKLKYVTAIDSHYIQPLPWD